MITTIDYFILENCILSQPPGGHYEVQMVYMGYKRWILTNIMGNMSEYVVG